MRMKPILLLGLSRHLWLLLHAGWSPWFRDPKAGVIPPRWKALLTAWIAPIFPAAIGWRFSSER